MVRARSESLRAWPHSRLMRLRELDGEPAGSRRGCRQDRPTAHPDPAKGGSPGPKLTYSTITSLDGYVAERGSVRKSSCWPHGTLGRGRENLGQSAHPGVAASMEDAHMTTRQGSVSRQGSLSPKSPVATIVPIWRGRCATKRSRRDDARTTARSAHLGVVLSLRPGPPGPFGGAAA